MNNGKAIMETQDSEECIYLLAAQRQLYTESKRWKAAQFGASLAIPFVITLGQVLRVTQIDAAWAVATEALIAIALTALPKAKEGRRRAAVRTFEIAQLMPTDPMVYNALIHIMNCGNARISFKIFENRIFFALV